MTVESCWSKTYIP